MNRHLPPAACLILSLISILPAAAQGPPCRPCAGVVVEDPAALTEALAAPPALQGEARLYVSWPVELDGSAELDAAARVEAAGAVPWPRLVFRASAPLLENAGALEKELEAAAALARKAGARGHFQIVWRPETAPPEDATARETAYLIKRAAVALTGAQPEGRVIFGPLAADAAALRRLYEEEVAAYVDGIALAPASEEAVTEALAALAEVDPGRPAVLDALAWPEEPWRVLAEAARWAEAGIAVTLFDATGTPRPELTPLKLLAREFQGDLSFDPYSPPATQGGEGWTFVRGSDLGLRAVVVTPEADAAGGELTARFEDPQLKNPARLDPATGEPIPLGGARRDAAGLTVRVADPEPVVLLRLERMTAEEIEGLAGLEEEVTVGGERQIPVEEILRRLQAFEDAQHRKLDHYQALSTQHLRFQGGGGVQGVEATFEGDFFFTQDGGFDWAWQRFFVNGVRWRGESIPEIPLIQPAKAAALPLEILFTKEYRYRLRGTDTVDGRDCWVVDFEPAGEVEPGRSLYQGTVWIDRQIYARARTRALQVGLEDGEVLSNEETFFYSPIDAAGRPAAWSAESFLLPLRVTGQQLLSVLNTTIVVEKETVLTGVAINSPDFDERRAAVLASEVTMVRDTEKGLRYLVKDENTGERVVQEGFKPSRLFGVGGVFYDDSLDYPVPLAGVDWFSFDFRGTGKQVNLFFGGVLVLGNLADPDLFGSRWDAGVDVFGFAVPLTDEAFRDNRERPEEEVERRPARVTLNLGHPLGSFGKLDLGYTLEYNDYGRSDDTADDFAPPSDHFLHTFRAAARYSRAGYRLRLGGALHSRSQWDPWGFPGNPDFSPEAKEFATWEAAIAKTWYFPNFLKFGAEIEYLDGQDLDRFSKYEFGFFSDVRVRGYQSDRVRAERALAAHLNYGFEVGELLRLEVLGDAAWATDELSGLEDEFLAGVGVAGTFIGPWQTIINLDVGTPLAGPDDGVTVFLTFLKLFK